jgi:hypothetical protein
MKKTPTSHLTDPPSQSLFERFTAALNWQKIALASYFAFWGIYFTLFWSEAVFYDAQGNLVAGHVNIWGDWAVHFTMATAMAQRGLVGLTSPLIIGHPFSYPFVSDYISALLVRIGVPLLPAFTIPSFIFSMFLVVVLYFFYRAVFKSRKVAVVSSLIFLLNGGLGFAYFLNDILTSPHPLTTLINPAHEYTRMDQEWIRWISVIDSMVIPQRAFTLGFPIAVLALLLIWKVFFDGERSHRWLMIIGAGALLGFLPIIHTHSFLAVFVVLACWSLTDLMVLHRQKLMHRLLEWAVLAGTTALIALPLISIYFLRNVSTGHFYSWYPGWLARDAHQNWLWFWWQNWGMTPYLAVLGVLMLIRDSGKKWKKWLLSLPFFLLFASANLILFQPWPWDNTKIIVWSALGFAGLSGYVVVRLTTIHLRWPIIESAKKALIPFLFLMLIASGGVDAYRILRTDLHSYVMYSATDLQLADWVKKNTDAHSIWLTNNHHNHWLFNLTGRQAVMTYPGWLWTQGYTDWMAVQSEERVMYAGGVAAENVLKKYGINYVVVGDLERRDMTPNEIYFDAKYPIVKQLGTTKIYKIR